MKSFSLYIPAELELLDMVVERRGWAKHSEEELAAIREDYEAVSQKHPILAVADGVTLRAKPGKKYPSPSGPGIVAKMFTETAIKEAEKMYESINENVINDIFRAANVKIGEYNRKCGYTSDTINFWDEDYYATTAGLVIEKNGKLYWAKLCDTRVAHLSEKGKVLFMAGDGYDYQRKNKPKNWEEMNSKEKWLYNRKNRNTVEDDGTKRGYGVLTGENGALTYLEKGVINAKKGEVILLFSDGFTGYIEQKSIRKLFAEWPDRIENELLSMANAFVSEKRRRCKSADELYNFLYEFGSERTVVGLRIE